MRLILCFGLLLAAQVATAADPFTLPGAIRANSFADVGTVTAAFDPPKVAAGGTALLRITVSPKPGCYTYPLSLRGEIGARSVVALPESAPLTLIGAVDNPPGFRDAPDPLNRLQTVRHYEDAVTFTVAVKVRAAAAPGKQAVSLVGTRIQVCTESNCFNSDRDSLPKPEIEIVAPAGGSAAPKAPPQPVTPTAVTPASHAAKLDAIASKLTNDTALNAASRGGFAGLIFAAIFWGFVSLATPCVFPMIPITVSLFLKQAKESTGTVLKLAAIYSLTIIVVLGSAAILLLTTFQALSVNEWMNLFLGGLFIFFALSLFGAFEVTLPKVVSFLIGFGWLFVGYHAAQLLRGRNLFDDPQLGAKLAGGGVILAGLTYFQLSGRGAALESRLLQSTERGRKAGGMLGTVAGAMAFSIVSFTCVAPFLGGFAGVLQSGGFSRVELVAAGLAFAAAFASPFFVLALFPSLIQQLPKSGGWMDTVKAVMGFLELAAAFKFFRAAEQKVTGGADFFTYELCLAAWVAISVAAGLYLLRLYRLPHDYEEKTQVGVGQLVLALLFLTLGAYLAPGLAGHRPGGGVYAWTNAFLLPDAAGEGTNGLAWNPDLQAAIDAARAKPNGRVLVDFTGVTCANCKYNEETVFPRPEVNELLTKYTLAQLYTDTVPPKYVQGGESAYDIAADNAAFQKRAFGDARLPLYVILAPEPGGVRVVDIYDEGKINDPAKFAAFLRDGLK